ncbi:MULTISPECIES: toll/interleukin-1 receptor domain-containing protein [Pseudomonas syringae group]|nr:MULTISPECIES: toll/interleukin-1 receptor domain-containing protein [Pseudomonas syringae group]
MPDSTQPLPINLEDADTAAIVVLADNNLVGDAAWTSYVRELCNCTEAAGLGTRVFPVEIDNNVLGRLGTDEQALLWARWDGTLAERGRRLTVSLTYAFCRLLRHYLERLTRPEEEEAALEAYLQKVQIFLSHSKHDEHGEEIARNVRSRLHTTPGMDSFFDVYDIPAGLHFQKVLFHKVRVSAMVAIHTDSYSSREWCRKEIIEAKRWHVPLVVANSLNDIDERGFPYMGNVPVVRLEPNGVDRIDYVIARLLDEVLKNFLWRCRIKLEQADGIPNPDVIFVPRPPELISLANLPPESDVPSPIIVYPDPPLSSEEERLFAAIAPRVQLRSLTEWKAGAVR